MKSSLRLSFLILLGTLCVSSQSAKNDGLALTGSIVGLNPVAECKGTDGRILIQMELSMQFRNGGERPLIVLKPEKFNPVFWSSEPFSTRVFFLRSLPSSTDKGSERIQVNEIRTNDCRPPNDRFYGNYDPIAAFIKRIDNPAPPSDLFEVIEPRGYYEFRQVVTLDGGYEVDVKMGKSLKEARVRAEYSAFLIQYHLSLKGNEKGEEFLTGLKSRWKSVGNLVLDKNGDFSVTSEPITNRGVE